MIDGAELLTDALHRYSPSGEEAELARFLVARMATFAERAFVDEAGNAVAQLGSGERHLIVLGHIDTVPGRVAVRRENGLLYGRGAVDAKGPFCAAVAAASRLKPEVLARLRLTLIGAVEEEVPSSKGARFAIGAYGPPDFVIVGEPSGWAGMTLGYKGRLVLRLRAAKANAHSATDEASAAEEVVEAWLALRGWARAWNEARGGGVFDRVQVALQSVQSRNDGLEQQAEAVVGLRLPPALPPARAQEALRRLLAAQPGSSSALGLEVSGAEEPYRGPKDTVLTRAFRQAIREAGGEPRFKVKTGTSDMNVVAPVWRVPMLAYGPGDSGLDHRPDEHVEMEEYFKAIEVLEKSFALLAVSVVRSAD